MQFRRSGKKPNPIIPVATSCVYLVVLFLGIMSYMYGSLYKSGERAHNLKILAVDFDNGTIGGAFREAYEHLMGTEFLTLEFDSAAAYPDVQSVNNAVCSHGYWGVVYTHPGATQRLLAAVSGNDTTPYNPNDTITYIYNGVYYPVIGDSYIAPKLQELAAATSQVFYSRDGQNLLSNADLSNSVATTALFQPINPSAVVLSPADTGPRVLLNTVTMVVPPLMQFFFIMSLDHISIAMHIFTPTNMRRLYFDRLLGSKAFGFVGALAVTAFIYAFRQDWSLTGAHFAETWMCFWFYMDISYQVMDSVIGTIVPMKFAPFFIFTWVIINVTSTLFPFELNPGFYRWGYALPAHNIWWLLMSVWSDGCISKLQVALPVCFVWWVVGHITSAYAVRWKCMENSKSPQSKPISHDVPIPKEPGTSSQDLSFEHS